MKAGEKTIPILRYLSILRNLKRHRVWSLTLIVGFLSSLLMSTAAAAVECPEELAPAAEALSSDPVAIYEFVRNEVTYEPYFGWKKGPVSTFDTLSGNDYDTASLLASLLVCAGYEDVSYVRGRVLIPATDVMDWLGVGSGAAGRRVLNFSEPVQWPFRTTNSGGTQDQLSKIQIWVRVGIAADDYRGTVGAAPAVGGEVLHFDLDASFKLSSRTPNPGLPFGVEGEGLVAPVDPSLPDNLFSKIRLERPAEFFNDQVRKWLGAEYAQGLSSSPRSVRDISANPRIIVEDPGVLPTALPYEIDSSVPLLVGSTFDEIHADADFVSPSPACGGVPCPWDDDVAPEEGSSSFAHVTMVHVCDGDTSRISSSDCLAFAPRPAIWGPEAAAATGLNSPPGSERKFAQYEVRNGELGRKSIMVWMPTVKWSDSSDDLVERDRNCQSNDRPRKALVNVAPFDPHAPIPLAGIPLIDAPGGGYNPEYPVSACSPSNRSACNFVAGTCDPGGGPWDFNDSRIDSLRIYVQQRAPYARLTWDTEDPGVVRTAILRSQHVMSPHGTYLVSGTGSSSSASSARLARQGILATTDLLPVSYDALKNEDPFIDFNRDGVVDPGDRPLHPASTDRAQLVGSILHAARHGFWESASRDRSELAHLHHQIVTRIGGTGLFSSSGAIGTFSGLPMGITAGELLVDIKAASHQFLDRGTGNRADVVVRENVETLAGVGLSSAENEIWEDLVGQEAISSVRGLQVSSEQLDREILRVSSVQEALDATASCVGGGPCGEIDESTYCTLKQFYGTSNSWRPTSWNYGCPTFPGTPPEDGHTILTIADRSFINDYGGFSGHVYNAAKPNGWRTYTIVRDYGAAAGGGYILNQIHSWLVGTFTSAFQSITSLDLSFAPDLSRPEVYQSTSRTVDIRAQNEGAGANSLGDPVSITSGAFFSNDIDIAIDGPGSSTLSVLRSYGTGLEYEGPLGYGWVHSYDQHVFLREAVEDGEEYEDQDELVWQREDSWQVAWEIDGTNYLAPPSNHNRLTKKSDGSFSIRTREGMTYEFGPLDVDGRGNLLSMHDRNGNTQVLGYDAGTGLLETVTDDAGRSLTFSYDAAAHLLEISDWTGRQWRYVVDGNGDLIEFWSPVEAAKEDAVAGSGAPFRYTYWAGEEDDAVNHNVRCWIAAQGGRPADPLVPELCGSEATGHAWMYFEYYENGRVLAHTDALARRTYFEYDQYRFETRVRYPDGAWETHRHDKYGNVIRRTDAKGAVTSSTYDAERRELLSVMDDFGLERTATYHDSGLVATQTDPMGGTESFTYSQFGQVESYVGKRGEERDWNYDRFGNLRSVRATMGGTSLLIASHRYDSYGNRVEAMEYSDPDEPPAGTHFEFDQDGISMLRVVNALGHTVRFGYDDLGRATQVATDRTIAGNGSPLVIPIEARTEFDANDRATLKVGVNGVGVSADLDADGLATVVATIPFFGEAASGTPRTDQINLYDVMGRLVSTVDAAGERADFAFDERDRPVWERSPLGRETRVEYDENGNLVATIDASGARWTNNYDTSNRLASSTDPLGRTTRLEYDGNSQVVRTYGPGTAGERLLSETEYDPSGNPFRVWDEARTLTEAVFDDFGRVESVTQAVGLAEQTQTQFEYDLQGRMTARIDGNLHRNEIEYDRLGRQRAVRDALGRTRYRLFDEIGEIVSSVNAEGDRLDFEYNARGLLSRRYSTEAGDIDDRFAYDGFGRRTFASNGMTVLSYGYDVFDRVVTVTDHEDRGGTSRVSYDEDGFVSQLVTPESNFLPSNPIVSRVTRYEWDPRGQISSISDPTFGTILYGHDAAGRRVREIFPRNLERSLDYTVEGYLASVTLEIDGVVTDQRTHSNFDDAGNPRQIDQLTPSSGSLETQIIGYDVLSRLTAISYPGSGGTESFGFDAVGNRTGHTDRSGTSLLYEFDAADQLEGIRLNAAGSGFPLLSSFEYDLAGRRLARLDGGAYSERYSYDSGGRLTSFTNVNSGEIIAFGYDANGERRSRLSSADEAFYAIGEWAEWRGSEHHRLIHAPGIDRIVGDIVDDEGVVQVHALHQDVQQNVVLDTLWAPAVAGSAVVGTSSTYEAFGTDYGHPSPESRTRGFAGRPLEGASGLAFLRARHYDPRTGTFLQRDPLYLETGWGYAYGNQNPIRFTDPFGLDAGIWGAQGGGFAIGNVIDSSLDRAGQFFDDIGQPTLMLGGGAQLALGRSFDGFNGVGFSGGLFLELSSTPDFGIFASFERVSGFAIEADRFGGVVLGGRDALVTSNSISGAVGNPFTGSGFGGSLLVDENFANPRGFTFGPALNAPITSIQGTFAVGETRTISIRDLLGD